MASGFYTCSPFLLMRYHFEKPDDYRAYHGHTYYCNHPLYDNCTLYKSMGKGLAVIQQRFNPETKHTYWTAIDPWLIDQIYLNPGFLSIFYERADTDRSGIFPTITVRQLMWKLRMKPLKKQPWETVFDRKEI